MGAEEDKATRIQQACALIAKVNKEERSIRFKSTKREEAFVRKVCKDHDLKVPYVRRIFYGNESV